jgi:hypothetical protein
MAQPLSTVKLLWEVFTGRRTVTRTKGIIDVDLKWHLVAIYGLQLISSDERLRSGCKAIWSFQGLAIYVQVAMPHVPLGMAIAISE